MAHNLTDSIAFTPSVSVPDDGVDFRTAASLVGALQALANRTRYAYSILSGAYAQAVIFASTLDVVQRLTTYVPAQMAGINNSGQLNNTGAINCTGSLIVAGNSILQTVNASGGVSCQSLHAYGSAIQLGTSLSDTCDVYSTAGLHGPTTCFSTLAVVGAINITGGGVMQSLPLRCLGPARVTRLAVVGPLSGSGTLATNAGTDYYFGTGLTGTVTMQISDAGAGDGDEFTLTNDSATYVVNIVPVSGIGFFGGLKNASGFPRSLRLKRIAGTWYTLNVEYVP